VRPATAYDAELLAQLDMALFGDNSFNERTMEDWLRKGWGWLVDDFAYAMCIPDGELVDLIRIGVLPEHQGRGLGTMLLEKVMEDRPVMLMVRKHNFGAIRLYHQHGFKIISQYTNEWASSWVMITSEY
jgi:GNAT superfamily N-acetyltransferase